MSKTQQSRSASSQAAWAILTEGVAFARVEAHRLRHQINRALKIIEKSKYKEVIYQRAGDLIVGIPQRLDRLENVLDRTSYALTLMGKDFLKGRIPLSDRTMVDEAVEGVQYPFGTSNKRAYSPSPSEYGTRTFVDEDSVKGLPGNTGKPSTDESSARPTKLDHTERALPIPSGHDKNRDNKIPKPMYNAPGPASEGKPIQVRTQPQKGEEYGHPYKENIYPRRTMQTAASRVADFYRQREAPMRLDQNWDRGSGKGTPQGDPDWPSYEGTTTWITPMTGRPGEQKQRDHKIPADKMEQPAVDNNPGSAKVIPSGHGFVNKEAAVASTLLKETSREIRDRSKNLHVSTKKNTGKLRVFAVGDHTVEVGFEVDLTEGLEGVDIKLACSCPFWRFQGPEYWAKQGNYLQGRPKGWATRPTQRDPHGQHRLCKHVVAVLEKLL